MKTHEKWTLVGRNLNKSSQFRGGFWQKELIFWIFGLLESSTIILSSTEISWEGLESSYTRQEATLLDTFHKKIGQMKALLSSVVQNSILWWHDLSLDKE